MPVLALENVVLKLSELGLDHFKINFIERMGIWGVLFLAVQFNYTMYREQLVVNLISFNHCVTIQQQHIREILVFCESKQSIIKK